MGAVPIEQVPSMLVQLAALQTALAARLALVPTMPAPPDSPCLVTAQKVSEAFSLPVPRVYELTRTGQLPAIHIGRSVRYDLAAVRRTLARVRAVR